MSSGLGSAGASIGHHASVNDVRESAFEAAQRLVPTLASGEFATEVAVAFGARRERRDVERPVQLAVSTAAEAMALDLPARHLKRRRPRVAGVVRDAQVRDDSSSASRRARQNDATAQPCPARPSRACLASRTNRVPVVTRIGGRGNGAAVDDGPGCRRRADAAALSSRGRDLGGRGPKRRVLRQADGGRAQTSLSWLADTLLSQDRAAPIRFCRPTGSRETRAEMPKLREE